MGDDMVIYLEVFLLTNLIIHLLSIFLISKLLNLKITKGIYFSSIIDLLWMLVYVYYYDYFYLFRYLIGIILVILCFKVPIMDLLKALFMYFSLNFLLGGVGLVLKVSGNLFYFLIIVCYFILTLGIYIILVNKKYETYYDVSLYYGKKINLKAFFDTGCNLSCNNLPVIIINNKKIVTKNILFFI